MLSRTVHLIVNIGVFLSKERLYSVKADIIHNHIQKFTHIYINVFLNRCLFNGVCICKIIE